MKSFRLLLLLLVFASLLLSGCGIIGSSIQQLGNTIPNLTNMLKIENAGGSPNPVRIEDGEILYPGLDE